MDRKVFTASLMLAIGVAGFSQTSENKYANPKELAKTVVLDKQKVDLDNMKRHLKDRKSKPKFKFNNKEMKKSKQFLCQEELAESVLKLKPSTLEKVFDALTKKEAGADLVYEIIQTGGIDYKKETSGKKRGRTDSTTIVVPVRFETHTVTNDKASDARYAVTFNWELKVKAVEKKEKRKVEGKKKPRKVVIGYEYERDGAPVFVSSVPEKIAYLTTEREDMRTAAKEAILEWYANLPQTIDQYVEQPGSVVEAMNVSLREIKMSLPESRNFTVADVPVIPVKVNPYKEVTIAPTFVVSVDETLKKAKISLKSYKCVNEKNTQPVTDSIKLERRRRADTFIQEFAERLSVYVSSGDAEQKAHIENMFSTAENSVQVSHLPRHGSEKTKKESAKKYLSLLNGSSLNMENIHLDKMDSNLDTLIYVVDQEYQSDTYSDYTKKKIFLTYDAVKESYVIEKIEVVPNSTVIR